MEAVNIDVLKKGKRLSALVLPDMNLVQYQLARVAVEVGTCGMKQSKLEVSIYRNRKSNLYVLGTFRMYNSKLEPCAYWKFHDTERVWCEMIIVYMGRMLCMQYMQYMEYMQYMPYVQYKHYMWYMVKIQYSNESNKTTGSARDT